MTEYDEEVWADRIDPVGPFTSRPGYTTERERAMRSVVDAFARAERPTDTECNRSHAVSLLIDHSGSMNGENILIALAIARVLLSECRRRGLPAEILGFSTVGWQGLPVRTWWRQAGAPRNPGRLCAIRHLIYADFSGRDVPLDLMLRPGVLKENVDGEAILWALGRLAARPEPEHRLILLSDGVPAHDSTLAANPPGFLSDHAAEVAEQVAAAKGTRFGAVHIGRDCAEFYPRIARMDSLEDVAGAMRDAILPFALS